MYRLWFLNPFFSDHSESINVVSLDQRKFIGKPKKLFLKNIYDIDHLHIYMKKQKECTLIFSHYETFFQFLVPKLSQINGRIEKLDIYKNLTKLLLSRKSFFEQFEIFMFLSETSITIKFESSIQ